MSECSNGNIRILCIFAESGRLRDGARCDYPAVPKHLPCNQHACYLDSCGFSMKFSSVRCGIIAEGTWIHLRSEITVQIEDLLPNRKQENRITIYAELSAEVLRIRVEATDFQRCYSDIRTRVESLSSANIREKDHPPTRPLFVRRHRSFQMDKYNKRTRRSPDAYGTFPSERANEQTDSACKAPLFISLPNECKAFGKTCICLFHCLKDIVINRYRKTAGLWP